MSTLVYLGSIIFSRKEINDNIIVASKKNFYLIRINDNLLTSVINATSWELWCIGDSWLSLEKEINDNIIVASKTNF